MPLTNHHSTEGWDSIARINEEVGDATHTIFLS